MRFISDSQRKAAFANMGANSVKINRFAANPDQLLRFYTTPSNSKRCPSCGALFGMKENALYGKPTCANCGWNSDKPYEWARWPWKKKSEWYDKNEPDWDKLTGGDPEDLQPKETKPKEKRYLNEDDTSEDFVPKDNFAQKSVAQQYKELDDFLKSKGMTWEEYMAGKPVPGTLYDQGVPSPEDEYHESLRRGREKQGRLNKMSVRSIEDIKLQYSLIWSRNETEDERIKNALKFLRREAKSKREDVSSWAMKEIDSIYADQRTEREEARMEDLSRGMDTSYFDGE